MDENAFERQQWVTLLLSACLCAVIVAAGISFTAG